MSTQPGEGQSSATPIEWIDHERAFTLSEAVDPAGIKARVRNGVLHLRLPKAGPAKLQRIEVRAD